MDMADKVILNKISSKNQIVNPIFVSAMVNNFF